MRTKFFFFFIFLLSGCASRIFFINRSSDYIQNIYNQPITWRVLPVEIEFARNVPYHNRRRFMDAADFWNVVAEADIFEPSNNRSNRNNLVLVRLCDLPLNSENQQVQGRTSNVYEVDSRGQPASIVASEICIWNSLPDEDWWLVSLHELGHVLGLTHDEDRNSIMYPHATSSSGAIERRDREFVRNLGFQIH